MCGASKPIDFPGSISPTHPSADPLGRLGVCDGPSSERPPGDDDEASAPPADASHEAVSRAAAAEVPAPPADAAVLTRALREALDENERLRRELSSAGASPATPQDAPLSPVRRGRPKKTASL